MKWLTSTSLRSHTLTCKWQKPILSQQKEENGRRNDFMINLHESMWPGRDQICDPWICSQTHYRLRYAGQLFGGGGGGRCEWYINFLIQANQVGQFYFRFSWCFTSWPHVLKLFPYSTQLSTKFILLINVKMPTIVGILTFISMINTTSEKLKAINFFICRYFSFYEQLKFRAQLSWAWNFFTATGPQQNFHSSKYIFIMRIKKQCWALISWLHQKPADLGPHCF